MPELVLYTTGFCAPCRTARHMIDYASKDVAFTVTEINASDHPESAMADGVTSTPTLISRGPDGAEQWRIVGVPRLAELRRLLGGI
ncbi:thioredoxin family protein [Flaviflexus huanghaiensis]|uniref:thioredoxin family protein n=1 Tax=Flaviflexus huanghaiensis TaxID=1111473 RepID=UPI0015FC3CCA|nr:thioredoxin family protein [Flaviflexus huanghaiensis]